MFPAAAASQRVCFLKSLGLTPRRLAHEAIFGTPELCPSPNFSIELVDLSPRSEDPRSDGGRVALKDCGALLGDAESFSQQEDDDCRQD